MKKSHIFIIIMSIGLLMVLLQLGGIVGGYDSTLMNTAITTEGEVYNTQKKNEITQQELRKTQQTINRMKAELTPYIGNACNPDEACDDLEEKIQGLRTRIEQRHN